MIETTSRTTYDREADALYVYLGLPTVETVAATEEVAPGIMLDRSEDGRVVGIEILDVSHGVVRSFVERLTKRAAAE